MPGRLRPDAADVVTSGRGGVAAKDPPQVADRAVAERDAAAGGEHGRHVDALRLAARVSEGVSAPVLAPQCAHRRPSASPDLGGDAQARRLRRLLSTRAELCCEMKVLVVDDEPSVRSALQRALALERYEVSLAEDGQQALDTLAEGVVDAIVLDVMMPRIDGLEVCRRLRAAGDRTPVLMLDRARRDRRPRRRPRRRRRRLPCQAVRATRAPTRGCARCCGASSPAAQRSPSATSCSTAPRTRSAAAIARSSCRARSSRCWELFLEHPRQVLSTRSTLFERVWGYDFGVTSNALGVYIGYLRRKTEEGGERRLLHTVRGIGYVLREP